MGALAGVASVEYDCATATVTMKGEATLTEDAVRAALTAKKLVMSTFRDGSAPTVQVHVFTVPGLAASRRDALTGHLRAAVPDAAEILFDSGSRVMLRMRPGKSAPEQTITRALAEQRLHAERATTAAWPDTFVTCSIRLTGGSGKDAPEAVRAALEGLDKVLAALVFEDGAAARIFLREPCQEIEKAVRSALAGKGFGVVSFDVVDVPRAAAPPPAAGDRGRRS